MSYLRKRFRSVPPAPEVVKGYCDDLAFLINRVFSEKLTDEEMKQIERHFMYFKNLSSYKLKELQVNIKELCRIGCELIQKRHVEDTNQVVERVIEHIRQNVASNMTVNDYAKLVYLSGSYFANLFKKVTGMTVVTVCDNRADGAGQDYARPRQTSSRNRSSTWIRRQASF